MPDATAQRSRAAAPSARNCRQPRWSFGQSRQPDQRRRPAGVHADGRTGSPSRRAPPPLTASHRVPVTWLTTTAATGPAASNAQMLVAHHGRCRGRVGRTVDRVEDGDDLPTRRGGGRTPRTGRPSPASSSTPTAARSATRSLLVLAGPGPGQAPVLEAVEGARTAVAASWRPRADFFAHGRPTVPEQRRAAAGYRRACRSGTPPDDWTRSARSSRTGRLRGPADEVVLDREAWGHLFGRRQPPGSPSPRLRAPGAAGFALWYPTFSTFLGRPGIWLEDLCPAGPPGPRARGSCWPICDLTTAGSSGPCSIGTSRPSPSTAARRSR